ncbi:hypothetical protein [Xanthomonas sacchari]|uniref:hypothetical protein n=1 Tax=Xanthomonas sacchari TaxID=56458 RepID=UPI0027D91B3A|nr:hypothetical protein [Xanthomonas sacchari]
MKPLTGPRSFGAVNSKAVSSGIAAVSSPPSWKGGARGVALPERCGDLLERSASHEDPTQIEQPEVGAALLGDEGDVLGAGVQADGLDQVPKRLHGHRAALLGMGE